MFFPRSEPYNTTEYNYLEVPNIVSKMSITIENTYDKIDI